MRPLCRPPPWDRGQHPPHLTERMILGCPTGHQLRALLFRAQAHADHQPLLWPPPWDMAQSPAINPCHIPIRVALPSPGWIFLQPEISSAGNRDCDAKHQRRDLVHPLLRPSLLLPTGCPSRALALHPLDVGMPRRELCPPARPPLPAPQQPFPHSPRRANITPAINSARLINLMGTAGTALCI